MTKLSTYRARVHKTGSLRVSRGCSLTEGADVFRTLGANVFSGLALEAPDDGGNGGLLVRKDDGVVACSHSHNHLQSSRECNTSSPHCSSWLSVHSTPSSLSGCSIPVILLLSREWWGSSRMSGEESGVSGHLGRIDGSISGGE